MLRRVRLFATQWTVACQAPRSMEFSRQEYWRGLPCLPPGDLPNPGIKPSSPALQAGSLLTEPPGIALYFLYVSQVYLPQLGLGQQEAAAYRELISLLTASIRPHSHLTGEGAIFRSPSAISGTNFLRFSPLQKQPETWVCM